MLRLETGIAGFLQKWCIQKQRITCGHFDIFWLLNFTKLLKCPLQPQSLPFELGFLGFQATYLELVEPASPGVYGGPLQTVLKDIESIERCWKHVSSNLLSHDHDKRANALWALRELYLMKLQTTWISLGKLCNRCWLQKAGNRQQQCWTQFHWDALYDVTFYGTTIATLSLKKW